MYRIYVGDMHTVQRGLHKRYGPVIRIAPNEVSSSKLSTEIYKFSGPLTKTDFYWVWGRETINKHKPLFVETNERVHSSYRRIVNPVYSLTNVLKNEGYINEVSKVFIERLGEYADQKEAIDLGKWLQM
jgi:hypothetical protein